MLERVPSLPQLAALVAAAAHGSMGGAARQLGISQQAVSARVTAAEKLLGIAVLQRSTTGVRPTGQGQLIISWARQVLDAAQELHDAAGAMRVAGDRIVVAASNTICEALLPTWAGRLRRAHPAVSLEVLPGNSQMVIDAVSAGQVDLGFVEGPRVPRDLRSQPVGSDELIVVTPPDHPWAARQGGIDRAELASTRLILREQGSGTRNHIEQAMPGHAAPLHTLNSSAAVRDAARVMGAPTVLSDLAVEQDIAAGRLVQIPVRDLTMPRTLRALWNPHQRPRGAAAELLRVATANVTYP